MYYGREKLYHHIQQAVLEGRGKKGAHPLLSFWHAFSLMMESKSAYEIEISVSSDILGIDQIHILHAPFFDLRSVL